MLDDKDIFAPSQTWMSMMHDFVVAPRAPGMTYVNGWTYFEYLRWVGSIFKDPPTANLVDDELRAVYLLP